MRLMALVVALAGCGGSGAMVAPSPTGGGAKPAKRGCDGYRTKAGR